MKIQILEPFITTKEINLVNNVHFPLKLSFGIAGLGAYGCDFLGDIISAPNVSCMPPMSFMIGVSFDLYCTNS